MSALSRNKGRSFEQLVARMLTEATGTIWRRRVRNAEGESDIVADDQALAHIVIECKHANTLRLPEWWRQAQDQAARLQACLATRHRAVPMLVYRQTRGPVRVQIDAHDVHSGTWPIPGRYQVTLDWEGAMQWLREQIPSRTFSPGVI